MKSLTFPMGCSWLLIIYFIKAWNLLSKWIAAIVEPDFWAENQIFKNFSKSLKTCLVGVFWEFRGIFSIIRHLSREPDFSAKNRILQKFLKCLKACLVGVFWVFQSILALFDIWAENWIFEPRTGFSKILKKPQNMFSWCFLSFKVFLALFDIWAENRMFEPRTGFSRISLKASKHV